MKVSQIILLFIFSSYSVTAQFSVEQYLSLPFKDAELEGLAKQMEYLSNESFRSPLFRELEIRLRSNDFNLSPEDYRLRLGFINPFERRANKSFTELQADYFETKYDYEVNLILANRYKQLVLHYYYKRSMDLLNDEINLLLVSYEQMQASDFNIKLLIETDEDILKKEIKRKEIQTSLRILENYILTIHEVNDSVDWNDSDLITVNKIKELMLVDTAKQSTSYELALKSFRMDEQLYKIEKAESFRNIGFFQAEYDTDRGKEFNDHMGFQLGISLPVFNVDKPKLQREKLELLEAESDIQKTKDESEIKRFNLTTQLLESIWNYETVDRKLQDIEEFNSMVTYDELKEYLTLIKYLNSLQMLKNDSFLQCVNTYIDLLALTGQLSQSPFVNYISNDLNTYTQIEN